MSDSRRLRRSRSNRRVAGICGGLGDYFAIDPTWIRLAFIAAALLGGPGVLIYLVLWVAVAEES